MGKLRESVLFAHTTSEEVMTKLGHKDAIVLFRPKTLQNKFESAEVIYEGADPVDKWVKANYHGICGVRTTDNAADFKNPLVTAYYAVDYVKNAKGTNYWRNCVKTENLKLKSPNSIKLMVLLNSGLLLAIMSHVCKVAFHSHPEVRTIL